MFKTADGVDITQAKGLDINVKIDENAPRPSILNVAIITDSNGIIAQVNGDETSEVSLSTPLAEGKFVILVYPIW